jgi:hypothetical protein
MNIKRYQLYTQPLQQRNTQMVVRMHTAKNEKKRKLRKEKSRHGTPALAATAEPPPRQHLNSSLSKSDASKKEIMHKRHHRPIKRS